LVYAYELKPCFTKYDIQIGIPYFLERILHRSQELCKFSFEYFLQLIEQASSEDLKNQNFIPDIKLLCVLLRKAFANVFKLKISRALYFSEVG